MAPRKTNEIRDRILEQALPDVAFDGWTWDVAERAAMGAGYDKAMARAVFPGRINDFTGHFSAWADEQMMAGLEPLDPENLRIRDRIAAGVMARIDALTPWREATRRAVTYWAVPTRSLMGGRLVWRTADAIWVWAGDQATDYNHYTKRVLLSGVITATTLAWLNDETGSRESTEEFLARRIENVMQMGKIIGRIKKPA